VPRLTVKVPRGSADGLVRSPLRSNATTGERGSDGLSASKTPPQARARNTLAKSGAEKLKGKWCRRCRQWLPVDAFRPNSNASNGVDSWCRSCHAKATREWRAKNPDYIARYNLERHREYRAAAHPLPTRPCVVCGEPFTGRPDALVCSEACRRRRKSDQRKALRVA
jgi:hypothetical protein